MAVSEVMVLSSSPLRPTASVASSPALPSPSRLLGTTKQRSYSTKSLELSGPGTVPEKPATVRRVSGKRKYGESETPCEVGALRLSRQSGRKSLEDAISTEDTHVVVKSITQGTENPKRSRAKQDGVQTKITKGKVTKPMRTTQEKAVGASSKKRRKSMLSEADPNTKDERQEGHGALFGSEDLCLEKALKRKTSWTPPKDTVPILDLSETTESTLGKVVGTQRKGKGAEFGEICRAFGLDDKDKDSAGNRSFTASAPGKAQEVQSKESRTEFGDGCRAFGFGGLGKNPDTPKSPSVPTSKTPTKQGRIKVYPLSA